MATIVAMDMRKDMNPSIVSLYLPGEEPLGL
jgi:hypothetical protein